MPNLIKTKSVAVLVLVSAFFSLSSHATTIGDFVWHDLNANGLQESGEPGIASVTVSVTGTTTGSTLSDSQSTDANGNYRFDSLNAGAYFVTFTAPPGYDFSPKVQGGDPTIDSDADPFTGQTDTTGSLGASDLDLTLDAGLFMRAALGDRVWHDLNRNGVQDSGEFGVSGVTVTLYEQINLIDTLIATTTTASDGFFEFTGLIPSDYLLEFALLPGYEFTIANAPGSTDINDSDVTNYSTGRTGLITLISGQTNHDVDAGITQVPEPTTVALLGFGLAGFGFARRRKLN